MFKNEEQYPRLENLAKICRKCTIAFVSIPESKSANWSTMATGKTKHVIVFCQGSGTVIENTVLNNEYSSDSKIILRSTK